MEVGDWVRLKQPFYPLPGHSPAYQYGIVEGVVASGGDIRAPAEILLKLVDPKSHSIYTDKTGARALYSFYPEEVEATEASQ
ncbi:hypothetical protein C7271_19185 [filamentous cyanobacterium CCP5]|nr:hypothetical protein C7271_19185 [filamentous cyanobacterium CCP5]